ncbi:MAG: electron transfer flavoprotein subunit beta [Senegalia sp. (in: firmicutes)]|uniref:electron transfer flavoprotein subunit beta n=1 Tax=Senegalia sp. (in: firmicutes) TaxID=1924098 RepID=UPI003F9E2CAA
MKIVVCVKQVPDTNEVKIDPIKGTLIREGIPSILNPDDANALEGALQLKDKYDDVSVTVLTMGPPQADDMLRECLAMGADDAIHLSGREFAGGDTWATSNAIAAGIKQIEDYDIIFAGRQAIDGDTAQVGPQIAERLGISQVTYVQDLKIDGDKLTIERQLEDGYEVIEAKTPILLTAIKELGQPRYMSVKGIFDAYGQKEVNVWGFDHLGIEKEEVGLNASPTRVKKSFVPSPKGKGVMLEGSIKDMTDELVIELKQKYVI